MKQFFKKYWTLVLALVIILVNVWLANGTDKEKCRDGTEVRNDTTTYVDTIPYFTPVEKESLVLRYDTLRLPLARERPGYDSITGDSVRIIMADVTIPIEQKVYRDTSYIAWVSGYRPCLDSIKVFSSTRYVTRTVTKSKPPDAVRRFYFGPSVGYGITLDGRPCPYIGVGLCYNLFSF